MAFEKIHRPLFAESKHVDFPNNDSVSTSYNGAFCKVRRTSLLSRRRPCNYLDGTAEKNRYISTLPPPGGTPLYKLYKYVPLHRVGFLRRFGLTTGIHFAHFGLEWGHERNLFFDSSSKPSEKKSSTKKCFWYSKITCSFESAQINSSHQLYDHALMKMDGVSKFISTAFFLCP